ncbi:MAG TPA: nickel pincer cofactor biosynthesis protein LarC [Thermoanaerobaculaceae bacterium]|nr:nickel pincer cofactor biosynthesis protein LarC [Thermoanaerobaculaceae bacterium]HRS15485.1 nickel pincer cofactor biosynthesis protein LarC [Thermoanaerobaculaceae bacterium]
MGTILYFDPFAGASGDMLLGALVDLGVNADSLRAVLDGLDLPGWRLEAERDRQQGFAGTRVRVEVSGDSAPARRLADVQEVLSAARIPQGVRERAVAAFECLFEAEAEVHGIPVEQTHLHELAAVDAVIDIVGVCAAVELLGADRLACGPVPVGSGTVQTAHGLLPVPPPAVSRLLRGIPIAGHAAEGEMTTPTGATLLRTLVREFGPLPSGTIQRIGVGLGTRQFAGIPNVLRVFLLEEAAPRLAGRSMVMVETTIDDQPGEVLGWLTERVRRAGAVDAWCLAGVGRKGRPVAELRALVEPPFVDAVVTALFEEGATLGVRVLGCVRPEIERHIVDAPTRFGVIPVKIGVFAGKVVSVKPELDVCTAAAAAHGVSLAAVREEAESAVLGVGQPWEG